MIHLGTRGGDVVKTLSTLALLPALVWGQAKFHTGQFHGRQGYIIENDAFRVTALRGGGHIAEIRFKSGDARKSINPMRVPHYQTIEPYQYVPAKHDSLYGAEPHRWLSSGYMGHLLCFPSFGPPSSEDEVRNRLGNHGEAPIAEWVQHRVDFPAGGVTLWYSAHLPKTRYSVERAVTVLNQESVVAVEEWVENLAPFDRPMNWVQHATFGPPFAEPGKNILDVSATQGGVAGSTTRSNSLSAGSRVTWPRGVSRAGDPVSLREFQTPAHSGTYYAMLLDPARTVSYFTLYHTGYPVLIGYLFPTADNPWIGDWQENQSNTALPWDGKVVARGLEFGTSPLPEGLRKSVERGTMLGAPTYRWIGGRQKLKTVWVAFLAEIPEGFAGVADVRLQPGKIVVTERGTNREFSVAHSRGVF